LRVRVVAVAEITDATGVRWAQDRAADIRTGGVLGGRWDDEDLLRAEGPEIRR